MTFYREDPEPRVADQRTADADFICPGCHMPVREGDPITLQWFGWTHAVQCPTEVVR